MLESSKTPLVIPNKEESINGVSISDLAKCNISKLQTGISSARDNLSGQT